MGVPSCVSRKHALAAESPASVSINHALAAESPASVSMNHALVAESPQKDWMRHAHVIDVASFFFDFQNSSCSTNTTFSNVQTTSQAFRTLVFTVPTLFLCEKIHSLVAKTIDVDVARTLYGTQG